MKISIVLPTFNRGFILPQALNSILHQTHQQWEIIVIDDGSTDDTENVVRRLTARGVVYIKTRHLGTPRAWNLGVSKSKYDYVVFLADDVSLHPNCLENLENAVKPLDKTSLGAVGPRLIYTRDIERLRVQRSDRRYASIDPITGDVIGSFNVEADKTVEVPILHGCSLVRKEAFLKVNGFDETTYKANYYREETDLWLRMKAEGYKLYYAPKAKIYCQKGLTKGGQLSNVKENLFLNEYYVLSNQKSFLRKHYGKKAYLMLPPFFIRRAFTLLKMSSAKLISKAPDKLFA